MRSMVMEIDAAAAEACERARHGDYEAALDVLRAVAATPAEFPVFRYFHAMVAMEAGRWSEALGLLDALLEVEPSRAVIHLDRVKCMMHLGQVSRAAQALGREDTPIRDLFPRWVLMAWVAARVGDPDRADEHLRHAIALDVATVPLAASIPELHPALDRLKADVQASGR